MVLTIVGLILAVLLAGVSASIILMAINSMNSCIMLLTPDEFRRCRRLQVVLLVAAVVLAIALFFVAISANTCFQWLAVSAASWVQNMFHLI